MAHGAGVRCHSMGRKWSLAQTLITDPSHVSVRVSNFDWVVTAIVTRLCGKQRFGGMATAVCMLEVAG